MARERGGSARASVWFDSGAKLPVVDAAQVNAVMSDAAASDDSDLRNDRALRHAAGRDRARRSPSTTAAPARTCWRRSSSATRRPGASSTRSPRFRERGFHGSHRRDLRRHRRGGAAAAARRRAGDARDRAGGDLDRRAGQGRRYQRRARIPRRHGDDARHPGGARGAARLSRPRNASWR